jgi:hypothetical protein
MNTPYKDFKQISYFQPDEMLFVIHHESDQPLDEYDIDGLISWSNKYKSDERLEILRVHKRELHFPGTNDLRPPEQDITDSEGIEYESPQFERHGAFSIVPASVRIIDGYRDKNNPDGYVKTSDLANLIVELDNKRIQDDQPLRSDGITIEAVSPNWLATPTYEHSGGGGPGARPVPLEGMNADISNESYEFQLPEKIKKLCPEKILDRGSGVKVAILDTAPCLHELVEAYERSHPVIPANQGKHHPLIESLLKPNGPLTVHSASYEELLRMRSVYLKDHDYKMTDHGLFVAGIIHSIAPAADIHLYEVLNPLGVGDIVSIATGLWNAVEEHYNTYQATGNVTPLVINCSLMLNIPLDGDPENPNLAKQISPKPNRRFQEHPDRPIVGHRLTDLDQEFRDKIRSDPEWIERAGKAILWLCDLIYACKSRVIAAAGNDWDPDDKGRPRARYPAAFDKVLGVGALPKEKAVTESGRQKVSSYSNISDRPGEVGVVTLGGEEGPKKGVLGIYLGEFPNGNPNNNNWAWWAGTSFATPIVTGAIAAVLSGPDKLASTEAAIQRMYSEQVIENAQTDYEEDRFAVKQGITST